MGLVRKLASLSARAWRDLASAQLSLIRAEWRMRTRPTGALLERWSSSDDSVIIADSDALPRAREIGDAVRRVGLYGLTRSQCLVRSLAICEMLEAEGIRGASVRVGVRPRDAALTAHAWVEYAGEIVGDSRAHVRAFEHLATAQGAFKQGAFKR